MNQIVFTRRLMKHCLNVMLILTVYCLNISYLLISYYPEIATRLESLDFTTGI